MNRKALFCVFVICFGLALALAQTKPTGRYIPSGFAGQCTWFDPMGARSDNVHLSRSLNGKVVWSKYFRYWGGVGLDQQGNTLFQGEELLYKINPAGEILWTHPNGEVSYFGSDKKGDVFRTVSLEKDHQSSRCLIKIEKLSPTGKVIWVRWRSVKVPLIDGFNLTLLDGLRVTEQRLEINFSPGPILYLDHNGKRVGQIDEPTYQQRKEVRGNIYGPLVDGHGTVISVDVKHYGRRLDYNYEYYRPRPKRTIPDPTIHGYIK